MIILGLGSNIEDRKKYLSQAIAMLDSNMEILTQSSIYQSDAVVFDDSPIDWKLPFLNMALVVKTELSPLELLKICKDIEQTIGRKNRGIWSPREIDIDILVYNDIVLNSNILTIPHKDLVNRDFALIPLAEITSNWQHPILKQTAQELVKNLKTSSGLKLWLN